MMRSPMTFIQSKKALKTATYLSSSKIRLLTSGSAKQLEPFLLGAFANLGIKLTLELIEFGTLHQILATKKSNNEDEVAIILPWDFINCLDWRLGGPNNLKLETTSLLKDAKQFSDRLKERQFKKIIYLEAPVLNVFGSTEIENEILLSLKLLALEIRATIVDSNHFNLQSYLHSGLTMQSKSLGYIAQIIATSTVKNKKNLKKVIITDLDMTLWDGILGEEGVNGISSEQSGKGFYHFIFQRQLKRFKNAGILLCVVSKNDFELTKEALQSNKFEIGYDDFVSVKSSYEVKSKHINEISKKLNLGVESMVFIDDNPVEIAQVSTDFPDISCLQFSTDPELFKIFLKDLNSFFSFKTLTEEDASRTELYKKMLSSKKNLEFHFNGNDNNNLDKFLKSLKMKLHIKNCSHLNCQRPSQLINKTNQFNMNGIRREINEVISLINNGGKLLSAELTDNAGSHGEIIAILIDNDGNVLSFVMSCRVFQRKVEIAFLYAVINYLNIDLKFRWNKTARNQPFANFVNYLFPNESKEKFTIKKKELKNIYNPKSYLFEFLGSS